MRHSVLWIALLLGAAAAACAGDSPPDEAGTYVLRTVGDSTVPFVAVASPLYRQVVVAETLTVDGHGGLVMAHVETDTWPGQPATTYRIVRDGRYRRFADELRYLFNCPPTAACLAAAAEYRLVGGGLKTVNLAAGDTTPVRFFERIP